MWTANRKLDTRTQEAPGDVGVVTLGGDPAGVYLSGERRWVEVYSPGGYRWRPNVDEKVLVLKAGDHQESPCLVGVRQPEEELEPGEVRLSGGSGQIGLCQDGVHLSGGAGQIGLTGDGIHLDSQVWVNGQTLEALITEIVWAILASLGGGL